jgi:protein-tyrosine phosphatase
MFDLTRRVLISIVKRVRHIRILWYARKKSRDAIKERGGNNILVICYGNIYRSPLAEYLLKNKCGSDKYTIKSAGFHNKGNRSCESEYLKILEKHGYDLSVHRSNIIQKSDTSWADIIILMDRYNWDLLYQLDPDCEHKIVWIGAFSSNKSLEVSDPYGKDYIFTERVIARIEEYINEICMEMGGND